MPFREQKTKTKNKIFIDEIACGEGFVTQSYLS